MKFLKPKLVCKASDIYFSFNKSKLNDKKISLPEGFTVTYHAGALHTAANSIYSVSAAVENKAEIIELDVSFRPDGTPVIIHSSNPKENQGALFEEALAEIAKSPDCRINLDLKSLANLKVIDETVKAYGLFDRVFYTGVFEDWVETVRNNSDIPYYLNHKITADDASDMESAQKIADKVKALGAIGINSHYEHANRLFVDVIHENGLLASLWTVDKLSDMQRVLDVYPDNITTRQPQLLKNLIVFSTKNEHLSA